MIMFFLVGGGVNIVKFGKLKKIGGGETGPGFLAHKAYMIIIILTISLNVIILARK